MSSLEVKEIKEEEDKPTDASSQLNQANILYDEKKFPEAFALYKTLADQGNVTACRCIGAMYYQGEGVEKDYTQAIKYNRLAPEDMFAQGMLGPAYIYGYGVDVDIKEGIRWLTLGANQDSVFTQAANQCRVWIQHMLGNVFETRFMQPNYPESIKWYAKASDQGYIPSTYKLGHYHYRGLGVPKDYTKAIELYKICGAAGDSHACGDVGHMYHHGHGVAKDDHEALIWLRRALPGHHHQERILKLIREVLTDEMLSTILQSETKLEAEVIRLKTHVQSLETEVESLRDQVLYQPGGAGHQEVLDRLIATAAVLDHKVKSSQV